MRVIKVFLLASTSHQSEENLPSSTTQEHKTPSQKIGEEADDSVVVKAKNPYSIDAILRTPTVATGSATSASANSSSSPIKRKLVDEDLDNKTGNLELTLPIKNEKKMKREDNSEEEQKIQVQDEEND
jgi:phosphoribosylaminoimidazole-succinocarboxamide synthase